MSSRWDTRVWENIFVAREASGERSYTIWVCDDCGEECAGPWHAHAPYDGWNMGRCVALTVIPDPRPALAAKGIDLPEGDFVEAVVQEVEHWVQAHASATESAALAEERAHADDLAQCLTDATLFFPKTGGTATRAAAALIEHRKRRNG